MSNTHKLKTLTPSSLLRVVNYMKRSEDIRNIPLISKKYKNILRLFTFNPTDDISLFDNMEVHFMYTPTCPSVKGKKTIVTYPLSIHESIRHIKIGRKCANVIFTKEDREIFGDTIPRSVTVRILPPGSKPQTPSSSAAVSRHSSILSFSSRSSFEKATGNSRIIKLDFVPSIGETTFRNDTTIQDVCFKDLLRVKTRAFQMCENLVSFQADSVAILEDFCFSKCHMLKRVTIGKLEVIGHNCFNECYKLKHFNVGQLGFPIYVELVTYSVAMALYQSNVLCTDTVFCQMDKKRYGETIPFNLPVHHLEDDCFAFSDVNMRELVLPPSVVSLGCRCFIECTSIQCVTLSPHLQSIGEKCFYGCTLLYKIELPDSLTSIGNNCFDGCPNLKVLTAPTALNPIRANMSYHVCKLFEAIKVKCLSVCYTSTDRQIYGDILPQSCAFLSLSESCFKNFELIQSITPQTSRSNHSLKLPSTLVSLDKNCFQNCVNLKNVVIPQSVESLGESCFADCVSLISVTLPSSVKIISNNCFRGCKSLKNIIFPPTVRLGEKCFSGCYALNTKLNAPSNCW
ncbi:hypothetical protein EIN_390890 [Entamoeba invadens IP1]|uniref:Leucine rich repeat containing protein BspA family protein n=1 Tax=Entamoeba invadens IP1 TaxID=370355 RepID=A0A0A1U596_ENTIV|nr:hypothetical protein EIN_390890 [Entamoeba invadens IP1]ELP89464.1 hypothetical protein EIN_390890 [Entamoeba invadens IP1]|eukprot:XP_004256235.1 hypothetical protein EIN_390890 [Entamoeba invadens IP1]